MEAAHLSKDMTIYVEYTSKCTTHKRESVLTKQKKKTRESLCNRKVLPDPIYLMRLVRNYRTPFPPLSPEEKSG